MSEQLLPLVPVSAHCASVVLFLFWLAGDSNFVHLCVAECLFSLKDRHKLLKLGILFIFFSFLEKPF